MTFPLSWKPRSENQVIGESYADGAFIEAVARACNVPDFEFTTPLDKHQKRALGKDGFKTHLLGMRAFVDREEVRRIVIVGDNDADHAAALNDVRKAVREAGGYPTPSVQPLAIAEAGGLRIGIAMLPAAGENGCLETILLRALRTGGPTAECLES